MKSRNLSIIFDGSNNHMTIEAEFNITYNDLATGLENTPLNYRKQAQYTWIRIYNSSHLNLAIYIDCSFEKEKCNWTTLYKNIDWRGK